MKFFKQCVIVAAALLACAVQAADNGVYLGVSAADVESDYDSSLSLSDPGSASEDNGFKLIGGIRPLDSLAVEIDYVDMGRITVPLTVFCAAIVGNLCPYQAAFETRALSVSALGYLSLPSLDLFARAGLARWEAEQTIWFAPNVAGPQTKESGTDPVYGVGTQLRFRNFALRLEYERFDLSEDSVDVLSLGLTYTFF